MRVPIGRRETMGDSLPSQVELSFQRCSWCSTVLFHTCLLCPVCASTDLRRESGPVTGRIVTIEQLGRHGHPARTLTVVELRDGVRVRCEVEGVQAGITEPGTPVNVVGVAPNGVPTFRVTPVKSERW
ncbi:hypothetical protein [Streptomyces sp. NPDC050145]|uniref:hypothetical protein n=1 Tax=Streptomyces sp. NPDC050145 TaxID=3365602 RepID=UPI0037A0BF59